MKLVKIYFAILVVAIILTVPVVTLIRRYHKAVEVERAHNHVLQQEIRTKQDQLDQSQENLKQQEKQIKKLKKEVSVKRKKAAEQQKLAQASSTPVSNSGASGNCASYRGLVAQYDWDVSTAMAIMQAESGCRANAVSPTCDRGLLQVNCVHSAKVNGDLSALFDPATNIRVAYQIYQGAGWSAWSVCNKGVVSCG